MTRVPLAVAALTLSSSAFALNPPANDQVVYDVHYVLDMDTPADTSDDVISIGTNVTGTLYTNTTECDSFVQPGGQPKEPDGCGVLDMSSGGLGYWLYYDGDTADAPPGGWNSGNAWWRNRLILRYYDGDVYHLLKYRPNPAHPDCPYVNECTSGAKFCGTSTWTIDGTQFSGGSYNVCMSAAP